MIQKRSRQSSQGRPPKNRQNRNQRRGVEAIEAAFTLPILFLILMPVLQITHHWHTQKMLKIATYEAIKAGGKPDGTNRDAEEAFKEYTTAFGIKDATLHFERNRFDFSKLNPDQEVRLRATAKTRSNQLKLPLNFSINKEVHSGWVYYRKEG